MSKESHGDPGARSEAAEFAEALKELERGERTAQAVEDHLDKLEQKIDQLLAQAEEAKSELNTQAESPDNAPIQDDVKKS